MLFVKRTYSESYFGAFESGFGMGSVKISVLIESLPSFRQIGLDVEYAFFR